jgi:hypothetical protein
MAHNTTGGQVIVKDMNRFLAVVAIWLMVLVALAQGGPGGPGGPGGGGSPTISFVAWKTDWTGNSPATNRFLFPAQLPSTEGFAHPVVYTKGGSAQLQIYFQNNNPQQAFVGSLIVQDARFIHSTPPQAGTPGSPPPVTIPDTILSAPTVSLSVPIGQTSAASLNLGGLPSFVTHGNIQLTMRVEGNFGAQVPGGNPIPWSGTVTTQKVYITLSNPVGVMNPVWTEVVETSCSFAQLESTTSNVNREITEDLFDSNVFIYDLLQVGPLNYTYLTSIQGTGPKAVAYNLKKHLSDPSGRLAGCSDINAFLGLLHLAQGIECSGRVVYGDFEVGDGKHLTNEFVPIGYDRASDPYIRVIFGWHFQLDITGLISDAAMAYNFDLGGASWKSPAYAWSYDGSWQTEVGSSIFGHAYRQYLPGIDYPTGAPPYGFPTWLPGPFGSPTSGQMEDKIFQTYTITEVF